MGAVMGCVVNVPARRGADVGIASGNGSGLASNAGDSREGAGGHQVDAPWRRRTVAAEKTAERAD
jgi:4-hydroxy-3-methylbut-2-en-1-yl diphosphate synthase IspG/GcpE